MSHDKSSAVPYEVDASFASFVPGPGAAAANDVDVMRNAPVQLTVELGRTRMSLRNFLQLAQGSVIELHALAGEPMDVLANGHVIAQGEVVVVDEKFGIRLTEILTPSERMRQLGKSAV